MATLGKTLVGSTVSNYNRVKTASTAGTTLATDYTSNRIFTFPSDMNTDANPFYIKFDFAEYIRPAINVTPFTNPLGSIILPIPSQNLADNVSLNYKQSPNTPVAGAFLNDIAGALARKTTGTVSLLEAAGQTTADVASGAGVQSLGAALGSLQKVTGGNLGVDNFLQLKGYVVNPFMTVMFQSPNFKEYALSWTFVPENADDSLKLRYIINKFRYHSLPTVTTGINLGAGINLAQNTLLGYPDMVKPVLYPQGYQFDFKWCVVQGIQVDYVPGDTPAFFAGTKAPVAIRVSLSLLEIEYWLKDDIVASTYAS